MKRPLLTACHLCEGTGIIIEKRGEGTVRARPCACDEVRVLSEGITDKHIDARLDAAADLMGEAKAIIDRALADLSFRESGEVLTELNELSRRITTYKGADAIRLSLKNSEEPQA